MAKNIVVFDFDGTLIEGDSLKLYSKWLSNNLIDFYFSYHFRFRFLKIFNPKLDLKLQRAKYYIKRQLKKKLNIDEFNLILKKNLFKDSLKILEVDKLNFDVYIVSASFVEIIQPFCMNFLKVNLITNNVKDYTKLNDINFKNKLTAVKSNIKSDFNIIKGYGNSSGDFEMLKHSNTAYYRTKKGEIIEWRK